LLNWKLLSLSLKMVSFSFIIFFVVYWFIDPICSPEPPPVRLVGLHRTGRRRSSLEFLQDGLHAWIHSPGEIAMGKWLSPIEPSRLMDWWIYLLILRWKWEIYGNINDLHTDCLNCETEISTFWFNILLYTHTCSLVGCWYVQPHFDQTSFTEHSPSQSAWPGFCCAKSGIILCWNGLQVRQWFVNVQSLANLANLVSILLTWHLLSYHSLEVLVSPICFS
jgi:hypothetical protein